MLRTGMLIGIVAAGLAAISGSAVEIKIPAPGAGSEAPLLTLKAYGYVKLDAPTTHRKPPPATRCSMSCRKSTVKATTNLI